MTLRCIHRKGEREAGLPESDRVSAELDVLVLWCCCDGAKCLKIRHVVGDRQSGWQFLQSTTTDCFLHQKVAFKRMSMAGVG